MKLLLDTHALLWFLTDDPKLTGRAADAIEDPANTVFVSHATPWEIAIKTSQGKLHLNPPYSAIFPHALESNGIHLLPTTLAHYRALIALPHHHRDPFDRLLIAQARVDSLHLVTCDSHFTAYDIPLIW